MPKRRLTPGKLMGAAVLGAIAYILINPKSRKKMQNELRNIVSELQRKSDKVKCFSRSGYERAVDTAVRMYGQSRQLTKQQLKELRDLGEELKCQWSAGEPKKKKTLAKKKKR